MPKASLHFRVQTDSPVAFITIDDGYFTDPLATAHVQANTLPVTQFLTYYAATQGEFEPTAGSPGAANVAELRKYQTGTATQKRIGCHQKEHLDYRGTGVSHQQAQMGGAADWLGDLFSYRPTLLRPPYGYYDDDTLTAAYGAGMPKLVLWTHAWIDGQIVNEWGSPRLRPGDIVLVHHPAEAGMDGFLLQQFQAAEAAIEAANLKPAYLHDYL